MKQGDIVLIKFPFTDLKSTKVRPAMVLSTENFNKHSRDAVFVMITSGTENTRKEDVLLKEGDKEFKLTGLKKESVVRTPKIYCLSKSLAKRKLGNLGPLTLGNIFQQLRNFIFPSK